MNLIDLHEKTKKIKNDVVINRAIDNTLDSLVEVNRLRMNEGIKADGSYMPIYSFISQTVYGYPNSPIKLLATGAFQAAMLAKRSGAFIIVDSEDSKTEMLIQRYGEEILGLTAKHYYNKNLSDEFKNQYLEDDLQPEIVQQFKIEMGLASVV